MKSKTLHSAMLMATTALALPMLAAPAKPGAKPAAKAASKAVKKPMAKAVMKPMAKPMVKGGAAAGMAEAKFDVPKPSYLGTPKQIKDTTAPPFQKRNAVFLPIGSTNLAKNKKATSSDDAPIIGDLTLITNGEKGAEEGQWVELGPSTQWVQIDLEKVASIYGVLLWHYHGESRVYRDVVVQLADDPDFVTNVRTVYNNDKDNTSGLGAGKDREFYEAAQGQWIPIAGLKARYVRFYSRGNTSDPQNQYIEAEVWGK